MRTRKIFFTITFFMANVFTQHVSADVSISALRFTESQKNEIRNLPELIENYIAEFNWTNNESDDQIRCNISIILETVSENGGLKKYKAQFIINSPAREYFYDKAFVFTYKRDEEIKRYSSEYRQIGNVLDFYIYMVLGGEMDTYSLYGGDEFYDRAQEAVTTGKTSEQGGWKSREKLLKNYTSPLVRSIRKAKLLYYSALNYKNDEKFQMMRKEVRALIIEIEHAYANEPSNLMLKRFFEGYHKRVIEVLDPALDQKLIGKLIRMDPVRKEFYFQFSDRNKIR